MRVLSWIVGRCQGQAHAIKTPLGWMPEFDDLHWPGLDFGADKFASVTNIDRAAWGRELRLHDELFAKLKDRLPQPLALERQSLEARLAA
jgi:phosphoenolpyruvate carboxykinase (GTP)